MKRNLSILASIAVICMMCSCTSQVQTQEPEYHIPAVREFVENNTYIDLPDYPRGINLFSPHSDEEQIYLNKLSAAHYRFYKHLKLENGHFNCDLKSGAEINISQDLFDKFYFDYVDDTNRWIDEVHARGNKATVIEITEEYLESLLKGKPYTSSGTQI